MQDSSPSIYRATPQLACSFCRKRKRACDRKTPKCSLCSSKGVDCDYSPVATDPSSTKHDSFVKDGRVTAFLRLPPSASRPDLPVAYFLDHQRFLQSGLRVPKPSFWLAPQVSAELGDLKPTAVNYFKKIHWWMPIISSKHVFDSMLNPMTEMECELPLLVLAMKLLLWHPSDGGDAPNPATETYIMTKHMMTEATLAGVLSLQLLQAQVLLALFEIGHALYPAAYLSVGACARYGAALGIDSTLSPEFQDKNKSVGPMAAEERRRTWWAILILDSFLKLGNQQLPLCTDDPGGESLLPADDELFDQGDVSGSRFCVSAAADVRMGALARMSQASCLLRKVYHYNHSSTGTRNTTDSQEEYWQLDRTIRSLLNLSYIEGQVRRTAVCGQTSICYSALIALHDPTQSRVDLQHMQFTADLLKPVADSMSWDSTIFLGGSLVSVKDASPLLLYWAYQAGTIYNRLISLYEPDNLHLLYQMKEKLQIMSRRWLAGGAYLELLNSGE